VAHSPENADDLSASGDYERGWDALGALLARGRSFSGREKNVALLNLRAPAGQALFADVSAPLGLDQIDDSRCVIPADWDGDGDLDLWYANRTGPRLKFFRNGLPPPPRWIAFTGIGQRASRDAIGLRIELHLKSTAGERRTLWRSLRAGDSFLSQTPKILHFAYREDEVIDHITFRWPAPGKKQSLSSLSPNVHYTVTETDSETPSVKPATAEPFPRLRPAVLATAEAPEAAAPAPNGSGRSGAVRARILERSALPSLKYYAFDGKQRELSDFVRSEAAEAVLVVVQAAWCAPCRKEMSELVARAADFQKARISVLSLAVDAARPDAAREDVVAAQAFIERLRWPFAAGLAPEATVKGLAAINARTLYPERDLPLPSAWLLDRNGRVAVIYQGALRPDDVLADFDGMNSVPPSPAWAFPFPGRMAGPLFRPTAAGLAQAWLQAGEPELARHELENALATLAAQPIDAPGVRSSLVECHALLGETELAADRPAAAAAALRAALSVLPDGHAARRTLAVRLWKAGEVTLATSELDRLAAIAATSGQVSLSVEVARSWRELQEPRRSLDVVAAAAKVGPTADDSRLLFERSLARQAAGDFAGAIADAESLIAQQITEARFNLAWMLATCRDPAHRDPQRALALLTAVSADQSPSAAVLDTWAAALAAHGQFSEASAAGRRALAAARAAGDSPTATSILRHLEKWEIGQLWIE
jgi:tetratricopeptide (TPR) repeat protein